MKDLYISLQKLINQLDFNKLYPGFRKYNFAIYNKQKVQFENHSIPVDHRFIGNTAIKYNNDYLAIWNVEETTYDEIVLASKIVHEMFHAWQYDNNEKRFPNEYNALDYHYNQENLGVKIRETSLLIKAFKTDDYQAIQDFFSLRELRKELYPQELIYESAIETVEGMARFVEIKALEQLDLFKYQKSLNQTYKYLEENCNYLPIRMVSYEIGMLILLYAEKAKISYAHDIKKTEHSIYQIVFSRFKRSEINFTTEIDFTFLENYKQKITELIEGIIESNPIKHKVKQIIGFNPLSSFKIEKRIYFNYFVMYEYDNEKKIIMNDCVGIVDDLGQVYQLMESNKVL